MTTLSVADARAQFSKLVESAWATHERIEVTRNGSRVAVLLGADDYDALIETLDILTDTQTMADLHAAQAAIADGATYSEDEIRAALDQRRSR
ncbi:MAG: type II toxin-antitoxin system Phd/YefM family antitoxin [Patulibacter sp.]